MGAEDFQEGAVEGSDKIWGRLGNLDERRQTNTIYNISVNVLEIKITIDNKPNLNKYTTVHKIIKKLYSKLLFFKTRDIR